MKQETKAKKIFEGFTELLKPLFKRLTYENTKKYKRLINSKFEELDEEKVKFFMELAKL